MVALLPDVSYMLCQKIFFPTPTDAVMLRQSKQPDYIFDGFSEVFCPKLPNDPAHENEMLIKRHPHHLKRSSVSSSMQMPEQKSRLPLPSDHANQPLQEYDESLYETHQNVKEYDMSTNNRVLTNY